MDPRTQTQGRGLAAGTITAPASTGNGSVVADLIRTAESTTKRVLWCRLVPAAAIHVGVGDDPAFSVAAGDVAPEPPAALYPEKMTIRSQSAGTASVNYLATFAR